MLIKNARFIFITTLLITMFLPVMPAIASTAQLQQDEIIAYHPLTGMVRFMGARSGMPIVDAKSLRSKATIENAALSFLAMRGREFGLADPANDLKVLHETQNDINTSSVRFQQMYHGIPILAGEMIVHMDSAKNVLSASGDILPNIELDTSPMVDETSAIQTALDTTALKYAVDFETLQASTPELWIYNPALLTPHHGETVLVWRMDVTPKNGLDPIRQLVLVDAKRDGVVLSFNQIAEILNRLTYDAAGTATLPGALICNESNATCSGGTADAVNAHKYAGDAYNFYMTNHGRDSIDGAGMDIISTINSSTTSNARWNGNQMAYSPGWSAGDDVVGHELTHGVTDYESNLFLFWQAGAISESFSDVWGEFIDLGNGSGTDTPAVRWKIGEDAPGGAVRDMSNPSASPYLDPDKMTSSYYYTGSSEVIGVHTNTGVNNKAVSLMVDGGTFNGQTVTGLGITKVAKIYYYVQTNLLTSGADYADLYYALQTSCAAQIGTAGIIAADCQEVLDAINAVEMNLQPLQPAGGYNPDVAACDVAGEYPVHSFYDDLENGLANWISGATIGTNHWSYDWPYEATLGVFAHSGQHFLFADILPVQVADTTIQMANSVIVPANGKMIFHHSYATGAGGVLEYSTTGGTSWIDAGSLMDGNGYDMALSNATNPLNGRQVFIGISHGYISTRLNLSSLAGQNIMFRFRLGLGSANSGGYGWWLDDIQIYTCAPLSSNNLPGEVRFAVVGDYGKASQPELDVASLIKSWNPDFVITVGDNNYDLGNATTIDQNIGQYYREFIYPYTGSYGTGANSNLLFPALGNHDWETTNAQPYLNYFALPGNERYYDYVMGPIHFFVIDSDSREPDGINNTSIQALWLKNALSTSTSDWNIVYFHHPPYSSGLHGSNPVLQWPFALWGADAVLSGHDHTYERIIQNGIPYFVNGLGGRSLYSLGAPVSGSKIRYNSDYGAMLVDGDNTTMTFQMITRNGVLVDKYILDKSFPGVSEIIIPKARPNFSTDIEFVVKFSEVVSGVDAADFQLISTGLTGAAITRVAGSGDTYTLAIHTGTGKGTLRVNLVDNDSILDVSSNPLGGVGTNNGDFFTHESYAVVTRPASIAANSTAKEIAPLLKNNIPSTTEEVNNTTVFNSIESENIESTSNSNPDHELLLEFILLQPENPETDAPFTITTSLPTTPKRRSPANNAILSISPTFHWTRVSEEAVYRFEYDNNADFSSPIFVVDTKNNYYVPPRMHMGAYYWHVRAWDAVGHWSQWSPVYTLTINISARKFNIYR